MYLSGIGSTTQLRPLSASDRITNAKPAQKEERLTQSITPPSEKTSYSKEDALLNQYMKQYRIDLNLSDGGPVRIMLPDQVPARELEAFRQKLAAGGLGSEIDWRGVREDFVMMEVGFSNMESLNNKIDYVTSRYAVLKDQIETGTAGSDRKKQLGILEGIYQNAKETLSSSYAKTAGDFFETYSGAGEQAKMKASMLAGIDDQAAQYETYLKNAGNHADIQGEGEKWLLQDDAYLAARLRETMSSENNIDNAADSPSASKPNTAYAAAEDTAAPYTLHDLQIAGVYAVESSGQFSSVRNTSWSGDEESLGLDLAIQGMKTEYLTQNTGIGSQMQELLRSSFQTYVKSYVDRLDRAQGEAAARYPTLGLPPHLNQASLFQVYDHTMQAYKNSQNMLQALQEGAAFGHRQVNSRFDQGSGSYWAKTEWDSFFRQGQYAGSYGDGPSRLQKYQTMLTQFEQSVKSGNVKTFALLFSRGSGLSSDRYTESAVDFYA